LHADKAERGADWSRLHSVTQKDTGQQVIMSLRDNLLAGRQTKKKTPVALLTPSASQLKAET
jgi:hypothetical protein